MPVAISPAAAVTSRISPSRLSSMPVTFVSRLTSRTPIPPLRSSGTGAALRVSSTTSTSRSRSSAAPAATASTSEVVVVDTTGSGAISPTGPGSSPRNAWPTSLGRITVSASTCRSSPAASSRCTGRSGGVPAAASRVRPTGEPSNNFCSKLGLRLVESGKALGEVFRLGVLDRGLTRIPGQAGRCLGRHPHRRIAPHQRALTKVVDGRRHTRSRRPRRRPAPSAWTTAPAVGVGVQDQQRVDHRESQEVQVIGGSLDRLPCLRPRRQRRDGARRGLGQVGPQLQQPDQPLVGRVRPARRPEECPARFRSLLTSVKQAVGVATARGACHNVRRG